MIISILLWVGALIGFASVSGKALIPVAKLTATKKDDIIVGKVNAFIATIKAIVDKVGLNN